jgi:SAM-dependent methyltransferase
LSTYVLDQGFPNERARLDAMARSWDPGTVRLAVECGIGAGHRCLEVGAGTGSVAAAFAELVGPDGHVLAVDRDIRFLDDLPANVEVQCADVLVDDLPPARFDLVHARLLLAHLHPHEHAMRRLAAAVAPGGWLLLEDVDWTFADLVVPDAPVHAAMIRALRQVMDTAGGWDSTYGRHLLGDLLSLGFTEVSAQYRGTQSPSSARSWLPWRLLADQFHQAILDAGLLSEQQFDEWSALTREENRFLVSATMFAVRGRRP